MNKPCNFITLGKQRAGQQQQDTMQEDDPTVTEGTEVSPTATADTPEEVDPKPEDVPVELRCSPWVWTECEPIQRQCGKGFKIGTRGGPGCRGTLKQKPCFKPCGDGNGGGNGKKGTEMGDFMARLTNCTRLTSLYNIASKILS